MVGQDQGPFSYENWRAVVAGEPSRVAYEYPLFTDTRIIGNDLLDGYGPYQVINTVAVRERGRTRPSLILRVEHHLSYKMDEVIRTTEEERYHGGLLQDEIAALLYQEAIWIVESAPELSWIMFTSAVETVADRWRTAADSPIERLRLSRPALEQILLRQGGEEFVQQVAEEIAPYMGATKKFVDFILEFLPEPPEQRPPEWAQHPWDPRSMKASMRRIYGYRSRALHGGHPFPAPMFMAPYRFEDGVLAEKPIGLAAGMRGATWIVEDTPMLLHTFEYIVRKSILKWWEKSARTPGEGG